MPSQDNPGQGQGQSHQNYVVKTEFTDDNGKKWTVGSKFQGNEEAVRRALAAGRIAEDRPSPEPQTPA